MIVTAANEQYYVPMQATVALIHQYLPQLRLVIYDLGLDEYSYNMVNEIFNNPNLYLFATIHDSRTNEHTKNRLLSTADAK